MEIEFGFKREQSKLLGEVLRPVASLSFLGEAIEIPTEAYIDSGADLTLIPRSLGDLLGLKITAAELSEPKEIKGISSLAIPVIIKRLRLKLGEQQFEARVAWSMIEDVPTLLGREDVFKLFQILFDRNQKTIFRS
jgi:hypothetical protein